MPKTNTCVIRQHDTGYKALAAAVIAQAVKDYKFPQPSSWHVETKEEKKEVIKKAAIDYLVSEECRYICDVLEIDYRRIKKVMLA